MIARLWHQVAGVKISCDHRATFNFAQSLSTGLYEQTGRCSLQCIPPVAACCVGCTPTTGQPPPIAGTEGGPSSRLVLAVLPARSKTLTTSLSGLFVSYRPIGPPRSHTWTLIRPVCTCIPARHASACLSSVAAALTNKRWAHFCSLSRCIVARQSLRACTGTFTVPQS